METKDILNLVGFILGSNYRQNILNELNKGLNTPKSISKKTTIQINHVSNILKELSNKNLVKCKTPELRKGRIYQITNKGKDILEKINEI